jgi:hypothetical protein
MKKPVTILLIVAALLAACSPAYAQEVAETVTVGPGLAEQALALYGAAVAVLTALAAILPRRLKFTQLCARLATDLRGIRVPEPKPEKFKPQKYVRFLLVLAFLPGCAALGAAAQPLALSAAESLVTAFAAYAANKLDGAKIEQTNCEVENHPDDGELLVLCTAKYR